MDTKTPKTTVTWTGTLESIKPGNSVLITADYRETQSIRVAASRLMKAKGLRFSIQKVDKQTTRIMRIHKECL